VDINIGASSASVMYVPVNIVAILVQSAIILAWTSAILVSLGAESIVGYFENSLSICWLSILGFIIPI
jgi:hypothetical protein